MTVREQVSALADGHLHGEDFARAIDTVCAEEDARGAWRAYHLVGDILRSGAHSPCSDSNAFLARFQQSLAAEPVIAAPVQAAAPAVLTARHRAEAANEPVFRWKLVAGAASLVAVAAISWTLVGNGIGVPSPGAQIAAAQPQPAANSVLAAANSQLPPTAALTPTRVMVGNGSPQVMLRDPRLDQLLEAHQQAGGASQMPSGFLRNATFEGPAR
ncbi:sigma-E factor negative regulatory protein RseA [Variovorax paradoxus]|uniref:Sigma-E factor negative regulatory protein RseA n=2 Tax=Variovorax paradoxus TaxID=34073 RepID=A0AAE4BU33_VARPD|nr:sigma-E factor negative regulatory protein RseA [Variovorax paradoxus]MDR6424621.1 sigma-E factor negative regulatory protein RseA [Variovorax paradoxus]MDR6452105.1 sigma-E factor negative regulatory protein RseA [Variovorax paradoxus]